MRKQDIKNIFDRKSDKEKTGRKNTCRQTEL